MSPPISFASDAHSGSHANILRSAWDDSGNVASIAAASHRIILNPYSLKGVGAVRAYAEDILKTKLVVGFKSGVVSCELETKAAELAI